MPVNLSAPIASDLLPVPGVRIGVAEAGVRKAHRKDLTVFLLDEGTTVGGVFTQNRFCAAPVQVCREFLALHQGQGIRAMVVNTGNANAGTGQDGLQRARPPAMRWPPNWVSIPRRCFRFPPASSWSPCRLTALRQDCRPPLPMRGLTTGHVPPKGS